ncbi:hypothetical protein BRADI_2g32225v3 [Brachypodium distachyon]|uniref:No apical meristem-associated C-terminal domain-containing protein n=1 Tax=Brachypodium distachyon TaxID=15368 RepID=A0A0Q3G6M2_BRADI|nr:hypothetical protein BRADI_2g32225v3 [Brachypodium distachyon]
MGAEGAEGEEENDLEEIDEGVFDGSQQKQPRRATNYSDLEDVTLVWSWESVSLDAVTGNDQTEKKYWQFYRLMPPNYSSRTLRSLQGQNCNGKVQSHAEFQREAIYTSTLLKEAAPKKGAFVHLDVYADESDAPKGGRNSKRPDGRKKEKEKIKKIAESSNLNSKFDELIKSKEIVSAAKLELKKINAEKKHEQKLQKLQGIHEVEFQKINVDPRKAKIEEEKAAAVVRAEENKIMLMNPSGLDPLAREWWELQRKDILQHCREATAEKENAAAATHGGDGGNGDAVANGHGQGDEFHA